MPVYPEVEFRYCKAKRTLQIFLAVGVSLLLQSGTALAQQEGTGEPIELIVRPQESSSLVRTLQSGNAGAKTSGLFRNVRSVRAAFPRAPRSKSSTRPQVSVIPAFRLTVADSSALRRTLARWRQRADVEYAHRNASFSVRGTTRHGPRELSPSDPPVLDSSNALIDSLDHLRVVRASDAWSTTTGDSAVRVGIVDTGIFLKHPDLRDQIAVNEAEDRNGNGRLDDADRNGVDDDGNGYVDDVVGYDFVDRPRTIAAGEYEDRDPDPSPDPEGEGSGHGTAVAGVVAAAPETPRTGIAGVAPGVEIVPIRSFGGDGLGRADDIAAGILYGVARGCDVLNLSFGRAQPVPVIREAIEYANEQGVIVVAAAGNELTDAPHYPSDYPDVLSVVWLAEDGEGLPPFNISQYGIGVDLGAPGSNVFTTQYPRNALRKGKAPSREELYGNASGSSFSAPQVAGAAALLRSVADSLSPASVRSILTTTAGDLRAENWDHRTGAGRLDVARALSRPYPARTEITRPRHNDGTPGTTPLVVEGTAVDPAFRHYALYYAEGTRNLDDRPDPWRPIQGPTPRQVLRDTLGTWDVTALEPGTYTLRLVTRLRDGRTIEDRRRVYVDSTAPNIDVEFLGAGRVAGKNGVVADLRTDDPTRLRMTVRLSGRREVVKSESRVRRHGLTWPDEQGTGGRARLRIAARNPAGLTSVLDTTIQVPPGRENTALLRRTTTSVPRGRLLPRTTDFDGDGLREITLNQSPPDGPGLSDTLRTFEWTGDGFAPADTVLASLIPKDVGDTNDDGRQELLLQSFSGTALIAQSSPNSFPEQLIYADTTDDPVRGARLADLDADQQGEIVATVDSQWVVLERRGEGFRPVLRLDNPTGTAGRDSADVTNVFSAPEAVTRDLDGDGQRDLLVGDRDGDLVVYESSGDDEMEVAWTHETDRVDAGNRFGAANLTGDGRPEFITMTTNPRKPTAEGEFAPPISYYSVWHATGDDTYKRAYRLPIVGTYTESGAIATGEVDGDDREEVLIAHPPSLLVVDRAEGGQWRVRYEGQQSPSVLTRAMVATDFRPDGRASVLAATTGDSLARYVVEPTAVQNSPPRWTMAVPVDADTASLSWRASGADSVTVLGGAPGRALDPLRTTTDSAVTVLGRAKRRFALQAWRDGTRSPLSERRTVRPHPPATVAAVQYPDPTSVRLRFTEPLTKPRASQFRLQADDSSPVRTVQTSGGTEVVLRFPDTVAGTTDRLRWTGVSDQSGLPVGQTGVDVAFPQPSRRSLFVEAADILSQRRLRLTFSEPVPASVAEDRSRYQLRPRGRVEAAQVEGASAQQVVLRVEGLVIGPSGQEASLSVTGLTSTDGNRLAEEGRTVRLTRPAEDLSNVYVYPNPYRAGEHGGELTIAGLPGTATVRIYAPDGRLVRVLEVEDGRDGGVDWDLRNRRGRRVPSGIYLVRVEAPDETPVLQKAAVIR